MGGWRGGWVGGWVAGSAEAKFLANLFRAPVVRLEHNGGQAQFLPLAHTAAQAYRAEAQSYAGRHVRLPAVNALARDRP